MSTNMIIDAGICGFKTRVDADSSDNQHVSFKIESDCENIMRLAESLEEKMPIDTFLEIHPEKISVIMGESQSILKGCCSGCAVPVGIFKSAQVAAGLALSKDISITFN